MKAYIWIEVSPIGTGYDPREVGVVIDRQYFTLGLTDQWVQRDLLAALRERLPGREYRRVKGGDRLELRTPADLDVVIEVLRERDELFPGREQRIWNGEDIHSTVGWEIVRDDTVLDQAREALEGVLR